MKKCLKIQVRHTSKFNFFQERKKHNVTLENHLSSCDQQNNFEAGKSIQRGRRKIQTEQGSVGHQLLRMYNDARGDAMPTKAVLADS